MTLELYADKGLWPASKPVILLIDEPEVGLHPSAQRRMAGALGRLRDRSGVQALIATHSPIFINAASSSGVRIVRRRVVGDVDHSEIHPAADLRTVAEALGASPADVLLGQCFVVVEGATERAVLPIWARKLGIDLDGGGIRLFVAEGWSYETTLARLTDLVYPGARLYALLDGGIDPETERTKILARFGDRVTVKVLAITEIEGAYTESAVARWIVANGGDPDRATGFAAQAAGGKAKKALTKLTFDGWHRTYKVVEDGGPSPTACQLARSTPRSASGCVRWQPTTSRGPPRRAGHPRGRSAARVRPRQHDHVVTDPIG